MELLEPCGIDKMLWDPTVVDFTDEGDLMGQMHLSDCLDELSHDLFKSLFEDPLLVDKSILMEVDLCPGPDIQAEHSYSTPQSPLAPLKLDDFGNDFQESIWNLEEKTYVIKPEPLMPSDSIEFDVPATASALPLNLPVLPLPAVLAQPPPLDTGRLATCGSSGHSQLQTMVYPAQAPIVPEKKETPPKVKIEPFEEFLNTVAPLGPTPDPVQLPPTPPSSHSSDSEGSLSPRSLPPPSPVHTPPTKMVTSRGLPSVLSSTPLLTASHQKLQGSSGPLMLTEEEKRTLITEGYPVPNKLPLTKAEEKALKKVRRKIKNKISAQESRRKKKEYVDGLEKKVDNCASENVDLKKKVDTLESSNRSLIQQLQRLQAMVASKIPVPCKAAATQTSTCLLAVVLCFALCFGTLVPYGLGTLSSRAVVAQTGQPVALSARDAYAVPRIPSRNLLFHDETASFEEGHSAMWPVESTEGLDPATWHLIEHEEQSALSWPEELTEPYSNAISGLVVSNDTARKIAVSHYREDVTTEVSLEQTVNTTA
uniref:cyclic AMP-responsive element-binding protein 3-like protein 1 isoform X2 n=1 Tax=Myxine glutinosa TaxID=7769 RepID=UPI00358DF297